MTTGPQSGNANENPEENEDSLQASSSQDIFLVQQLIVTLAEQADPDYVAGIGTAKHHAQA